MLKLFSTANFLTAVNEIFCPLPRCLSGEVTTEITSCLLSDKIFKEGIAYKKAGVMIMGLVPTVKRQLSLFDNNNTKHVALMQSLDQIHKRFGPYQIKLANQDLNRTWKMKQEHLSKRFTTELKEVIIVK